MHDRRRRRREHPPASSALQGSTGRRYGGGMGTSNIAAADAGPLASDVMLAGAGTLPPTATVAQARAVFESPRQKLLVVCDGTRYVGAIRRDGLDGAGDAATIDG